MDIDRTLAQGLDIIPIGFSDSLSLDEIFSTSQHFANIRPFCDDRLRGELTRNKHSMAVKLTDDLVTMALIDNHPFLISLPLIYASKKVRDRYRQTQDRFFNNISIEISRGCTGSCNYCLVKKAKGPLQSRDIQEIIDDIKRLYDPTKELFLIGDDCGCYGTDKGSSIIELLDRIHADFPALPLKVNYLDPGYLVRYSEDFVRIFQTMRITMTTIPLQSGSQRVLKKMNRHYDVAEVLAVIKRLRQVSPETLIYSHYIVGHPGESWRDFITTLKTTRLFDCPSPFVYSDNKGTISSQMDQHPSVPIRFIRYALFLLVLNIVVFIRLTESLKIRQRQLPGPCNN
jgi:tRNA A37 methylthiotransferase MiaB